MNEFWRGFFNVFINYPYEWGQILSFLFLVLMAVGIIIYFVIRAERNSGI